MLDLKFIRNNQEKVKEGLLKKNVNPEVLDNFLRLDEQRTALLKTVEDLRAKRNIAQNKLLEEKSDKEKILDLLKELKEAINIKEKELEEIEVKWKKAWALIPNLPLENWPVGKDEKDSVVLREVGKKPSFKFAPKDYFTIAQQLDIIDTERAAKTSGARFGFLKREAALLELALIQFAFEKIIKKGFVPIIPPVLIKPEPFWAMGYLDRGAEEVYHLEKDDLYLIGTAEQILGPMHMNETLKIEDLPLRYVGFSSCFRREAGSYGKDTKGIFRVHQFDKIEMFIFSKPEESFKEHELLLSIEEELMQNLGIPYRVLQICTGDLGDPAAAKYDIEAWLPGQNNGEGQYRETHSTSNCTDYQSRRLNIKYRDQIENKSEFVYTLNGTGLAIGRMIIAIIENYQTREGWIKIPKVLMPYMKGVKMIKR